MSLRQQIHTGIAGTEMHCFPTQIFPIGFHKFTRLGLTLLTVNTAGSQIINLHMFSLIILSVQEVCKCFDAEF